MRKPAKKPAKKRSSKLKRAATISPSRPAVAEPEISGNNAGASKQARVIAMLRSPAGTTIDAIMQATGWQQHSVRGFLAGVVRKRLKLKLQSSNVDGHRVYRIEGEGLGQDSEPRSKRRAA